MINYSNGQNFKEKPGKSRKISNKSLSFSHGNRGMDLEADINLSNEFYKENEACLVCDQGVNC